MLVFSFLKPVFSHGQLYVAFSRVSSERKIYMTVEGKKYKRLNKTFTKNVVYKEIFDGCNDNNKDNNDLERDDNTDNDVDIINNMNNF